MGIRNTILAVLLGFLILAATSTSEAVNTRDIDRVRGKGVLGEEDLRVIDEFVAESVKELVGGKDFTSIASIRLIILGRDESATESAAAQYGEQFSESARKYISEGLKEAEQLTPQDYKVKVMVNLLILADGLENLRLADLAMERLNDENTIVRYWAVHSVTNAGIIKQLNSAKASNSELAGQITEQLSGRIVKESSPEIMALMVRFAGELEIPKAEDLLVQIADGRISRYMNWTVEYELLDAEVLKLLSRKMSSLSAAKAAVARRFAQLYSCVMQRYVKGRDLLTDSQKEQMVSVMVETEQTCIGNILEMPQSIIQKAVEQDDITALLAEHNRLLGDETEAGKLALKLKFDYGQGPDGNKLTAPLSLPRSPGSKVSE